MLSDVQWCEISRILFSRYRGRAFGGLNLAGLRRGIIVRFKAASAEADVVLVDPRGIS